LSKSFNDLASASLYFDELSSILKMLQKGYKVAIGVEENVLGASEFIFSQSHYSAMKIELVIY